MAHELPGASIVPELPGIRKYNPTLKIHCGKDKFTQRRSSSESFVREAGDLEAEKRTAAIGTTSTLTVDDHPTHPIGNSHAPRVGAQNGAAGQQPQRPVSMLSGVTAELAGQTCRPTHLMI